MCSRVTLIPLALLGISAFFYTVQAAPTAVATRGSTEIDTLGGGRVKRQGGGCGCCGCGCGCCGCGGGGCGCCCCRPCCCCQRCCTCCRTCCCTRCCTCCKPCCCGCGCGCGCCGCGGGRKRRSLQNLRIKLAQKIASDVEATTLPEGPIPEEEDLQVPASQQPIILPVHITPKNTENDA